MRGLITDFLSQSSSLSRPALAYQYSGTLDVQRSGSNQLTPVSGNSHGRLSNLLHRKRDSPTGQQEKGRLRSRLHRHKKSTSMSEGEEVQDTLRHDSMGATNDRDSPRSVPEHLCQHSTGCMQLPLPVFADWAILCKDSHSHSHLFYMTIGVIAHLSFCRRQALVISGMTL